METIRLLFVEDEIDIRMIVNRAIKLDPGIVATTYKTGVEALDAIEQNGDVFDFALINLRLPYMSGIEFFERLRMLPGMDNIIGALITASVRDSEVASYKRAGMHGYIAKPFDPVSLSKQIRSIYHMARV